VFKILSTFHTLVIQSFSWFGIKSEISRFFAAAHKQIHKYKNETNIETHTYIHTYMSIIQYVNICMKNNVDYYSQICRTWCNMGFMIFSVYLFVLFFFCFICFCLHVCLSICLLCQFVIYIWVFFFFLKIRSEFLFKNVRPTKKKSLSRQKARWVCDWPKINPFDVTVTTQTSHHFWETHDRTCCAPKLDWFESNWKGGCAV
jgi:hypothetical protein